MAKGRWRNHWVLARKDEVGGAHMIGRDSDRSPRPTVVIVEPNGDGHRFYYVRLLAQHVIAAGADALLLTSPQALDHSNMRLHLGDVPIRVVAVAAEFDMRAISDAARRYGAIRTIVPEVDGYLAQLARGGWRGPGTLGALVMRPAIHAVTNISLRLRLKVGVKRFFMGLSSRRARISLFVLRSPLAPAAGKLNSLPDPVTLNLDAAARVELESTLDSGSDVSWVGIFGAITPRKNLHLVAEAVAQVPNARLVLVGHLSEGVLEHAATQLDLLALQGRPVVRVADPITDAKFDTAISLVDCVVAAHSNEGPSGVVAKAAAAGTRLVLAGAESLRVDAQSIPDLAEWVPLQAEAMRDAVSRALRRGGGKAHPLGTTEFVAKLTGVET